MSNNYSRRSFFRLTGVAGAAGILATLQGCAADNPNNPSSRAFRAGSQDVNPDGTISAAISYELGTNGYDPMTTSAALTVAVNWHTLEGLTELDPATGTPYPALAAKLPDTGTTEVEITLREGAVFSNGAPVTADDVVFSYERTMDPDNQSVYASFIPFIKSVTAVNDRTVRITLDHPSGVLAERLAVVKIVPRAAVEADPDAFDAYPVGSGAWTMTDNGGASKIIRFERNDAYTGQRPARAKTMEWHIIPDSSTRINSLQSGAVQAVDSLPYLNITQVKATNDVQSVPGFGLLFAMFNNDAKNPFSDLRNRQGFLYALDMDKIIRVGLLGEAQPVTSWLQEQHKNYHRAKTVYAYDPERARNLFADSGLNHMRMLCTNHDWVKQVTPLIKESLDNIGVAVEFSERQSADLYTTIDGKPDSYDVVIAPGDPSTFGNDPDLLMRWWLYNDTWTETRMHWKGSDGYHRIKKLLDAGLSATDPAKQQEIWNHTFDAIAEEVPLYPLFHRNTPSAWDSATLVDFQPIPTTGLNFTLTASTRSTD